MTRIACITKNKLKVLQDFSYSILASLISVGVTQLLLYPVLANIFGSKEYGQLLTIMGIVNTISSAVGNTLNNTRLIQQTKYDEMKLKGDFNFLLSIANIIGFIITILIGNILIGFDLLTNLLLSVLTVLISVKSYFAVGYRIKLDYKMNFFSNLITSIGYIIGIIIAIFTSVWPIAFILGESFCIIFLLFTSDLHKETITITALFSETTSKYLMLIITGLLGNLLVYLDRLIIYPVLGGEAVSIYTTAAVFGKSLGVLMTPIAGVMLSYFSQKSFVMTRKRFWNINILVFIFSFLFFLFTVCIAPWFTGILYPKFIEKATPYILYANIAAIIAVASNIIQPSVLKFSPTYWQVVKEIVYGIIYLGLGYLSLLNYGILGFCWAAIIANLVRLILLCIIGTIFIKEKDIK